MPKWIAWSLCLLAACQPATGPSDIPTSTAPAAQNENPCDEVQMMNDKPSMPAGTLVQSLLIDAEGEASGYRIFSDGRYESRLANLGWLAGETLNETQMQRVREAIAAAGLADLAGRYRSATPGEDDAVFWFQVAMDKEVHNIAVEGECEVPALSELSAKLLAVFQSP